MDWHHLIYKTYVCLLQPSPLVQLSALRLVDISCCLAPDDVSATEHSASPVLLRGTACMPSDIRTASTLPNFKNRLKTHLFLQSYIV